MRVEEGFDILNHPPYRPHYLHLHIKKIMKKKLRDKNLSPMMESRRHFVVKEKPFSMTVYRIQLKDQINV